MYPENIAKLLAEGSVAKPIPVYAHLEDVKARLEKGDAVLQPALDKLIVAADAALHVAPLTIVNKPQMPNSGDKHDYMSMGPYWWPNPDTSDGLPYIRRDGEVNPQTKDFDRPKLAQLISSVSTLSLAHFYTGKQAYVDHATLLLRTWFLDAETRMNPNMNFAQAIPGICDGRGIGLIDSAGLAESLLPAMMHLPLSNDDLAGLQKWFSEFLTWMVTHKNGLSEARTKNNHATAYDVQIVTYAMFIGREDVARAVLEGVPERRIAPQIEPDGQQPLELARTKGLSYSSMNLILFLALAERGRILGVDLTAFETSDGRSICKALDWVRPFWMGQTWTHQQIDVFPNDRALKALRLAAHLYGDDRYEADIKRLANVTEEDRMTHLMQVLYPPYEG